MSDKIFCGSAKIITTKYGELTKISFSEKDIAVLTENLNIRGWVNVVVKEKKNKEEGKNTHYLEIDNYVKPEEPNPVPPKQSNTDDLPF